MPKFIQTNQDIWNSAYTGVFLLLVIVISWVLREQYTVIRNISLFDYFVLALATFRLIRLFVYDSVTEFIRIYFGGFKKGPKKTAGDLLNCPWCTGVWAALIVLFIYFVIPYSFFFILLLSIAGLGSIIQIVIWKIGRE